jgi:hypothetical protein
VLARRGGINTMNILRLMCGAAAVAALMACGGGPASESGGAASEEPKPTVVFTDDFEEGEATDWKTKNASEKDEAEGDEETAPQPE